MKQEINYRKIKEIEENHSIQINPIECFLYSKHNNINSQVNKYFGRFIKDNIILEIEFHWHFSEIYLKIKPIKELYKSDRTLSIQTFLTDNKSVIEVSKEKFFEELEIIKSLL